MRPTKEKYFNKCYPEPNTGCWIWGGRCHPTHGYGCGTLLLENGYLLRGSHRVSYYLFKGPFNPSLLVCHTCDNRWCINPDHLFLGTNLDNVKDMNQKGRVSHGERHYASKLTAIQVLEIRNRYKTESCSHGDLCKEYNVRRSTIYAILARRIWRHI